MFLLYKVMNIFLKEFAARLKKSLAS